MAEAVVRGVRSLIVLLVIGAALGGYLWYDAKHPPAADTKKQDKVFPGLQTDKIDQLTIKSESGDHTVVRKQGSGWQLAQPIAAPADDSSVSGIISGLGSLEVTKVVDDQPSDLKQFGLSPARLSLGFTVNGKPQTILIGQKTPPGTDLYAKLPDQPRVFLIASYLDATFNKSTFDLRDKSILKIDRDKVDRLDIQTPDHTLTFARHGGDWQMTAPVDARADFSAIDGVVGRLNTVNMKAITAAEATDLGQYGLDKPAATVTVGSGSSQAGLLIGKSAGEGVVYAKDVSRPMVFTVESTLLDDLKKGPDDFRIKDIFDARSFNTTQVEITRGGKTVTYAKDKDTWKQVLPAAKAVASPSVDALVSALTSARATGFVDKIADTGLDAPELTVSLTYEDGQKHEKVSFGRHGSEAFARRDGDNGAEKIDAATIDSITKALDALK